MDECQRAPVLHFLLTAHLSSAIGGLSRRTHVLGYLPHLFGPSQWGSRQPLQHVYLMEEVSSFFSGGLVHYELDSRYICLGVQSMGQQLQQINPSASFCPDSAACTNIFWRMNGWCSPLTSHWEYSFRNNSTSRQHSASWMDSPSSFASSLVARTYVIYLCIVILVECGN